MERLNSTLLLEEINMKGTSVEAMNVGKLDT